MGLFIDVGERTCEIEGVTFRVRVGDTRDAMRYIRPRLEVLGRARESDDEESITKAAEDVLRYGVVGWSGDGAPPAPAVEADGRLPAGSFSLLPWWAWQELINAITDAIGNNDLTMPATPQKVWAALNA